jgi:hypothetical protein
MLMRVAGFLLFALPIQAQVDAWDLPPVKYSDTQATDRLAELAKRWAADPSTLPGGESPLERVRAILAALKVPEASQVLVFSKTSHQNGLIGPDNPRAVYFSLDCYCAYVPGGAMEVAIQDPLLGPVFYLIHLGSAEKPVQVERDTNGCLTCHATGRTENVPGLLVRSVFPDAAGRPMLSQGSSLITHQTPIPERWGGYYVTGSVALPHLGNRTYQEGERDPGTEIHRWEDLRGRLDTRKYLRPTSDIVALMVLEHQCQANNLLVAARMNYQRAAYLAQALDPTADLETGSSARLADQAAAKIIDWFLFSGEVGQGEDGIEGDDAFQEAFAALVPRTDAGESLADFQLNTRIFKNRCSYMIYSEAFRSLPEPIKRRVLAGLRKSLEEGTASDSSPQLPLSERRRILRILSETGVWEESPLQSPVSSSK